MEEDKFTATQVGALIERLEGKFQFVLDIVVPLKNDMVEVKERLSKVETRLTGVEDAVRIAIPNLVQRVSHLESKAG